MKLIMGLVFSRKNPKRIQEISTCTTVIRVSLIGALEPLLEKTNDRSKARWDHDAR